MDDRLFFRCPLSRSHLTHNIHFWREAIPEVGGWRRIRIGDPDRYDDVCVGPLYYCDGHAVPDENGQTSEWPLNGL
jgi:hypothetical protein